MLFLAVSLQVRPDHVMPNAHQGGPSVFSWAGSVNTSFQHGLDRVAGVWSSSPLFVWWGIDRNHIHRLQRTARNVVTVLFQVAHGKAHPRSGDLIWINTPNLSLYCVYVDCGLQRRSEETKGLNLGFMILRRRKIVFWPALCLEHCLPQTVTSELSFKTGL